jgi:hypothetical protein
MTQTLHRVLWWAGGTMVLLALIWWTLVFRSVVTYDYLSLPQATLCLGTSNSICELAMSLCSAKVRHWLDVNWYSPKLLWLGMAVACAALTLEPRASK